MSGDAINMIINVGYMDNVWLSNNSFNFIKHVR